MMLLEWQELGTWERWVLDVVDLGEPKDYIAGRKI